MDVIRVVLSILVPPLGVFLQVDVGGHFWLNILLTILGYIPGIHPRDLGHHDEVREFPCASQGRLSGAPEVDPVVASDRCARRYLDAIAAPMRRHVDCGDGC